MLILCISFCVSIIVCPFVYSVVFVVCFVFCTFQYFDTAGWVFRPVKTVSHITWRGHETLHNPIQLTVFSVTQESRAAARKPRDAASVLFC